MTHRKPARSAGGHRAERANIDVERQRFTPDIIPHSAWLQPDPRVICGTFAADKTWFAAYPDCRYRIRPFVPGESISHGQCGDVQGAIVIVKRLHFDALPRYHLAPTDPILASREIQAALKAIYDEARIRHLERVRRAR